MKFPTRPLVALAVLAALGTSTSTALTLPSKPVAVVEVPRFASGSSEIPDRPAAASTPPVTGAQIVELVITPARKRVEALAAEAKAAADAAAKAKPTAEVPKPVPVEDPRERLREQIRQACALGVLRGPVCRT